MKKHPSVTVLVTVKNAENTIKDCIESLLRLDYPNYDIYVTDGYSEDDTLGILRKLKKRNPEKIRLERVKGNIAKAHNYMIKRVESELIAMTDADCVVDKKWLKNLISGFTSNNIIATTGFCSTPENVNRLQRLIGMELEHRFKHAPKFVPRGPTMNLCVKTEYAKRIRFDEKFDVAQETDWGYRLTKLGKMRYVSNAIVYHYHRSTFKSFLKQAFRYGRASPFLYLRHIKKSSGDHISKPIMMIQEFLFLCFCLSGLLLIFDIFFIWLTIILLFVLFICYLIDILTYTISPTNMISLVFLYLFRNISWSIGLFFGILDLFLNR